MTLSDRLATAVAGPARHPATNLICRIGLATRRFCVTDSCLNARLGIGIGSAALALGAGYPFALCCGVWRLAPHLVVCRHPALSSFFIPWYSVSSLE